ncbi:hypothetical protein [Streptomyces alkaliphilus]|uniref:hypothetical protein n=1 Tax=Streptomyces alkaliphilus TaxID=1472722 RepID=UPI001E359743|nr:hypothetical protein [Streptomyces alkaliphilus]
MLEQKLDRRLAEFGELGEHSEGWATELGQPVLATPATALAFVAGAALVGGAYVAGRGEILQ